MAVHRILSKTGLAVIGFGALLASLWPRMAFFLATLGETFSQWALWINCRFPVK
jgi:hypothetical protein